MDDEGVPGEKSRQDQLLEEASLWFARMRAPDADAYRPEFESWLASDSAHRGAYNRAGEVFALGKFLSETPDLETIATRNKPEPARGWRPLAIAASVALLLGVGAWFNWETIASQFGPASIGEAQVAAGDIDVKRISAEGGAPRSVTLADGSTVTLEPGSMLTTRFDAKRRALSLERGRARFDVAHEQRPFVVMAGGGSVTARGTIFDVIIGHDNSVTVHLLRGAVDVARPSQTAAATPNVTRLAPGETLSFAPLALPVLVDARAPIVGTPAPVPIEVNGAIEFEKTALSQVIAQTNQRSAVSIRLADPAIGGLQVSGRFRIDDPVQVADRLATLFDLNVSRVSRDEIVLSAR